MIILVKPTYLDVSMGDFRHTCDTVDIEPATIQSKSPINNIYFLQIYLLLIWNIAVLPLCNICSSEEEEEKEIQTLAEANKLVKNIIKLPGHQGWIC